MNEWSVDPCVQQLTHESRSLVIPHCTSPGAWYSCHRYDRAGIEQWLQTHTTSPLDPSCILTIAGLRPNRAVRGAVEIMINSGDMDEEVRLAWQSKKRGSDLKRAQAMFDAGRVLDAAKLGLPRAQGEMALRCYLGSQGVEKNLITCVEWASKAARGGDRYGQFRLGYSHHAAEGTNKNLVEALKWYKLAAAQGDRNSMHNIASIYELGGSGVPVDPEMAFQFYRRGAEGGFMHSQFALANCYYNNLLGATKNLHAARSWYEKSSTQGHTEGAFMLGFMKMRGEGGPKEVAEGLSLVAQAAGAGSTRAAGTLAQFDVFAGALPPAYA